MTCAKGLAAAETLFSDLGDVRNRRFLADDLNAIRRNDGRRRQREGGYFAAGEEGGPGGDVEISGFAPDVHDCRIGQGRARGR